MLKLVNVSKNYYVGNNVIEALKGVSLEFRQNEFVSILGPSGCGKTTLLNIIGGLDKYTKGDLIINNQSTKNFSDYDWDTYRNHRIGFVFQNYNLIHHQSVLSNVELALTLTGISKSERKKRAIEALESVGLHDQIYKRPNQLSGGQMQRVAIARALVNNPDIILADEPTGSLDSETSMQIMDILKEISKDRLIIMVTHNPALANKYSTRIIQLLDGLVTGDSNPFVTEAADEPKVIRKEKKEKKKHSKQTSMSFLTALNLSLQNLFTKKGRTLLTAFAGSIGIIGIALVLALSNGFQTYINKMQTDTLSAYPITIEESAMDLTSLMGFQYDSSLEKFPEEEKIYVNKILEFMQTSRYKNELSDEYIENVIEKIDKDLVNAIRYEYGLDINVFKAIERNPQMTQYLKMSNSSWSEIARSENTADPYDFFKSQYNVIGVNSRLPENMHEIVLVVNQYNQLTDIALAAIGLDNIMDEDGVVDFEKIIGQKYKVILNNNLYQYAEENDYFKNNLRKVSSPYGQDLEFVTEDIFNLDNEDTIELEIVGIVRPNEDTEIGSIDMESILGYTPELADYIVENSLGSNIIEWMNKEENALRDPFSEEGAQFVDSDAKTAAELWEDAYRKLGGDKKPVGISIYPKDFRAKNAIKEYLDDYNNQKREETINNYYQELGITEATASEEQRKEAEDLGKKAGVVYQDLMTILASSLNTLVDAISIVLIVFTSISLIVSSIMIGIITYISVLERTKEIGVLRSIGARKKDISRVFNAETLIIGFVAGLIGILIALILSIPANMILYNLVQINNLVLVNPVHALILILISTGLTLISGLIPSRLAANKDPVIALRSE